MSEKLTEKFTVECQLADEYLQTGHCPTCQNAGMVHIYDFSELKNFKLCVICGQTIQISAIAVMLASVPVIDEILPAAPSNDPDNWLF